MNIKQKVSIFNIMQTLNKITVSNSVDLYKKKKVNHSVDWVIVNNLLIKKRVTIYEPY